LTTHKWKPQNRKVVSRRLRPQPLLVGILEDRHSSRLKLWMEGVLLTTNAGSHPLGRIISEPLPAQAHEESSKKLPNLPRHNSGRGHPSDPPDKLHTQQGVELAWYQQYDLRACLTELDSCSMARKSRLNTAFTKSSTSGYTLPLYQLSLGYCKDNTCQFTACYELTALWSI
jgi:hypothetical protein